MGVHRISAGLDVPVDGAPEQVVDGGAEVRRVGLVGDDYPGLRARLVVAEGDEVARGQLLFEDLATPGVRYTAPGAGRVSSLLRRERGELRSIVIELDAGERSGRPRCSPFESYTSKRPTDLDAESVRALLTESGLWTALRSRPFDRIPHPATSPAALFVNAMDSEPLAAEPSVSIGKATEDFRAGVVLLSRLTAGLTYVCAGSEDEIELGDAQARIERFSGPHPAGSAGLHVHKLHPVGVGRVAWTIGYQDVIAIGELARTGVLPVERTLALGGPAATRPRLVRSRLGASLSDLTHGELGEDDASLVSGSVLSGRAVVDSATGFLGRYHDQVCGLWRPSRALRGRTTGPILPIGRFERVFPFDLLPTFLLRALASGDLESAERLGCLELSEEDLALCSYVCPAGNDYGAMLRRTLDRIAEDWDREADAATV